MKMSQLKAKLSRPAIVMDIGGFRPPEDPKTSWFGKVNLALDGETWPMHDGVPMHALCQINLTELPFRPAHLDDLAMIAVFIGPTQLPVDEPNGQNWCLRAYKDLDTLCTLAQPNVRSPIKSFPMKPRLVDKDFACLDDVSELGIDIDDEDEYKERCPNIDGLKLGGWPSLIQSTIYWTGQTNDLINPEYVFQIDSCEKALWQWGDGGVGYFGRGTSEGHKDAWALTWQCF